MKVPGLSDNLGFHNFRRRRLELRVPDGVRVWWMDRWSPAKRRQSRVIAGVLAAGLAVGAYFTFRPVPQPDYDTAAMNEVFNYTLLTDEFNNLPVEQRLALIGKLVNRLKNMGGSDSVLMASFAAGIGGAARDQLQQNGARLAVDVWDKYAKDYDTVKEEDRAQFLEQAFLDFTKMMETVAGEQRDISDSDRLNDVRKQADSRKQMSNPDRAPPSQLLGRGFDMMNKGVGGHANPVQRLRGAQLMRDMTRHFRGQDIATGKPK